MSEESQVQEQVQESVEQPVVESDAATEVAEVKVAEGESSEPAVTKEEFKKDLKVAVEKGASDKEIKEMIKEFELKVNGKTIKKKINLSDEQGLIREFQIAEANKNGMQRAAEIEKAYQVEMDRLKSNPFEYIKALGMDPDELAEARIQQRLEEMKKSPEQLRQEQLQSELETARQELKKQKEESERVKFEKLQEQESSKLDGEITEALRSHKTLPKTKKTVSRIADAMIWAIENGYPNVSVQDVLPAVEAEIKAELHDLMSEMPDEILESYLGKKTIERLRQKRLNSVTPTTLSSVKAVTKIPEKKEEEKSPVRMKDFFRNLK